MCRRHPSDRSPISETGVVLNNFSRRRYPKGVSLPTSESLPTPESVIDGTCKSGSPYARALAAIETIWNWFDLQKEWRALDDYTAANWQPGNTKIRYHESIRFISHV